MDAPRVHVQRRPPALSAAHLAADFDRQSCGLRMPSSNAREVRPHVPPQSPPCALTFEKYLPMSRLTSQVSFPVSLATWTAQLSTKASGHPLPVACCARGRSVRRSDRAPEGGRAGCGGTSHTDLTEGETRERRRTVRRRLTGQLRTCGITEGGSGALLRRGRWLVHDGQR